MSSFGSELVSELYRDMQDYCHGLVSLVAETRSEEEWDDVIKIVMANLGLQRLRFARKHHEPKDGYQQLMMAIKGLSQLRQLTLYSLTEATALQILEACPSLKHLTVSKLTFSHTPTLLHQEKPALRLSCASTAGPPRATEGT
ncbi:hypothetical protein BGZ73_001858 [Actinomortierella ambigua]|nr:hypothetical protein BGZ73_001858 [Actinomortierella ambigua]